jgi:hypothetical protein
VAAAPPLDPDRSSKLFYTALSRGTQRTNILLVQYCPLEQMEPYRIEMHLQTNNQWVCTELDEVARQEAIDYGHLQCMFYDIN